MLTIKLGSIYIKKALAKSNVRIGILIFYESIAAQSGIFMRA